jgi:hypothetical protein
VWVYTGAGVSAIALGAPTLFGRLSWLGQAATQGVCALAPAFAVEILVARHHHAGTPGRWVLLFDMIVIFLWTRYYSVRVACQQYVGGLDAAAAVQASANGAAACDAMLRGLLPAHVPISAVLGGARSAGTHRRAAMDHVRRSWDGLSMLQVQCGGYRHDHTAVLAALWAEVAPAIERVGGGLLQMVEAAGDVFLVAGPFNTSPTDAMQRLAATNSVALMRALRTLLEEHCAFTAVATAGSAFGALLGSSGLTFRLFGAAVRESNALLAAAPAAAGPAAFAAESFRRQHANFGVSARPAKNAAAGMSAALLLSRTHRAAADTAIYDVMAETGDFRAALRWRMSGVGVVIVSSVKL